MNTEEKAEVSRARYAYRKDVGLCVKFGCSALAQEGVFCEKHAAQARRLGAKARARKGARQGVTGRIPVDLKDPVAQAKREKHRKAALASYHKRKAEKNGTNTHPTVTRA